MTRPRVIDWLLFILFLAFVLWLAVKSFRNMRPLWRVSVTGSCETRVQPSHSGPSRLLR